MLFFLEFSLIPTSRSEDPVCTDREGPRGLPDFIYRKVETCPNPLIGAQGTAKQTMCICLIKMFYFNRIRGLSVLIKQKVPRYIRLLP